ncbi:hypothetical protein BLA60_27900 [Actinophytocola xinjiangensis]|uniref:Tetratricopeptide repeat protein n=1 Tax=Actinophytocola xinjiangensis TaxID=485602 RepID=A0A7Z0WHT8_9PSEU|nr:tetratricopeptide repeat protein [Actinophytocola xinjiangensis]OLF07391.1 hypothetical protein BLA60_27900 [Actinophytocola xinjiangensis]
MVHDPEQSPDAVNNVVAGTVYGPVVQAGNIAGGVQINCGARRHVIEPVHEPDRPDATWLMDQPSRLLDARSQVVPFTGRDTELHALRDWRDRQDARCAVRLLHAPGGQGKTRLAAEFAKRSRDGWTVAQARVPDVVSGAGDAPDLAGGAGLLLIVDYADRWAHSELTRLLTDPVLHQRQAVRVLLIGRTVRWYAAIRAELAELRAATDDLPLPPLADDRSVMFAAARDRYAQPDLYDVPDASGIQPPTELGHDDFGLTLTLHMAALVAVDARKRGQRTPSAPHELSAYLLDREYQAWQQLHDAGDHGQDYRTRPAVMARTVFTAALVGAVSHDTGTRTLQAVDLPGHPQDLLLDHRFCYPPADRTLVLEPLYPDRLAEDFLGLLTPGHDLTAYDPDPWTGTVPATLLTTDGLRQATVNRAVTFLASAAARWPHLADAVLYPLLRQDPGLAIEAGGNALATLADLDLPIDVLDPVYVALPAGSRIDIDVGAAAITGAYVTRMLKVADDLEHRAELHIDYSNRLSSAGQRQQSLDHSWRAVECYRELCASDPTHEFNLARAAHNHAEGLAAVGLRDDALTYSRQAVSIRERLAASDRTAHLQDLARSVSSHAVRLAENGQRALALEYSRRSVDLNLELAEGDHPEHRRGLARSSDSHAARLAEVGRSAEALEHSERAVTLYRQLAASDPDADLKPLAQAHDHHSWWLAEAGRQEEALDHSRQAVEIFEKLTNVNRVAFLADLAAAVANLANRLAEAGQRDEALARSGEAVDLGEELVEGNRIAHLPRLAMFVSNHAVRLPDRAKALEWCWRAVELREELVNDHRAAHLPDLAASVGNYAQTLVKAGRLTEALGHSRRATELWEELAGDHRSAHLAALMAATHNHGVWLSLADHQDEAWHYTQRAMRLRAELARDHRAARPPDPAAPTPGLAPRLNDHADQLAWAGHNAEALELSSQTVEQYRALAGADPHTYLVDLATALAGYAQLRLQLKADLDAALSASDEALRTYRQLAAHDPDSFTDDTLDAAHTLAAVLKALGRPEQAERVHRDMTAEFGGSDASR